MSLVLIDTTVLIDAERSAGGIGRFIDDGDEPAVAAISIAELGVGVSLARGAKRQRRQAFFDDVVAHVPVLPYDLEVAVAHRDLIVAARRLGEPRGAHDLIIAATARVHRREVVASDRSGFSGLPGVDLRPFTSEA